MQNCYLCAPAQYELVFPTDDMRILDPASIASMTTARLGYVPTAGQQALIGSLAEFCALRPERGAFILNGYAGTGKSSLVGALIGALTDLGQRTVVLAPTGRAAKVASSFSGHRAQTIHKRIYRPDGGGPSPGRYFLAPNSDRDTVFIVDEASMISDTDTGRSVFRDLLRHIFSAPGCCMVLVGDIAQLPPVGQTDSPAMNPAHLQSLGLRPSVFHLRQTVRQAADSGILRNATRVRHMLFAAEPPARPSLVLSCYDDIRIVDGYDLPDAISDSWRSVGREETILITRSNRRANEFNRQIRSRILGVEEPLVAGENIVISKNDYYWSRLNGLDDFLANGETAIVSWVGPAEKRYGRYFADVELMLPARSDRVLSVKFMFRSLMAEGASLPQEEMSRLYASVLADYSRDGVTEYSKAENDPYYNAVQAKYAYAVTCHKAQGGQWRHVYIDMSTVGREGYDADLYRWLYTAMTRATSRVYLIAPVADIK